MDQKETEILDWGHFLVFTLAKEGYGEKSKL